MRMDYFSDIRLIVKDTLAVKTKINQSIITEYILSNIFLTEPQLLIYQRKVCQLVCEVLVIDKVLIGRYKWGH